MSSASGGTANVPVVVDTFPRPPPYFKYFGADSDIEPPAPPPLPTDPAQPLQIFGQLLTPPFPSIDNPPTLGEEVKEQLYPNAENLDIVTQLKKLNHSLLFKFMELIDVLLQNPEEHQKRVQDIEVLFVNMHHLLNCYRPHQARALIISLLEDQIQKKQNAIVSIRETFGKVSDGLSTISKTIKDEASSQTGKSEKLTTDPLSLPSPASEQPKETVKKEHANNIIASSSSTTQHNHLQGSTVSLKMEKTTMHTRRDKKKNLAGMQQRLAKIIKQEELHEKSAK